MNEDQEIRAKALEIAVIIKAGGIVPGRLSGGEAVIRPYLATAEAVERYIRGELKSSPAEPAESS